MESNYALTKLYHPSGFQISIPLHLDSVLSTEAGKNLIASIDNLVAAGLLVNMPGLEEGELVEEVSAVARRESGDLTPIIDFYSSNTRLEKKFLHVYLNTKEDVETFEQASGLKLDQLTIYDGKSAIERTDRNAHKYIAQLPNPIKAVYKINVKWEQWNAGDKTGKEPHKRLLVRYETGRTPVIPEKAETGQPVATDGPKMYTKSGGNVDGELVTLIVNKMHVKPSVVAPILAKIDGPISFESALRIVEANLIDAQP